MMNYPSAASGLKMMLIAQILNIVGSVVIVLGLILTVVTIGILFFIPLLGSLLVFAGGIVGLMGLFKASADDEGYRGALVFAGINVVVSALSGTLGENSSILHTLLLIVSSILTFLVVNTVCQTTGNLLHSMGKDDLAERGGTVSKLYLICTAVTVVCTLVGAIPVLGVLAGVVSFGSSIVSLVGYVLYLGFLYSGGRALEY